MSVNKTHSLQLINKVERNKNALSRVPNTSSIFGGNLILDPVEQYKLRLGSEASSRTVETRINECAKIWGCEDRTQIVWEKVTKAHILGLIKSMEVNGKKISTIKNTLSCLKGAIKEAYDLDMIDSDNYQRIQSIRPPKGFQESTGIALEANQIDNLLKNLKLMSTGSGIRDCSIIHILMNTGLRRTEITNITIKDIDFKNRQILIKGKGNKERKVGLNDNTYNSMIKWITEVRGEKDGFLFSRIRKNGKMETQKKISDQSIYNIVKSRCEEVGILVIATHDLRRTFATHMLKNGIDLLDVMKMMGHSSPETTKRYDKSGQNKALNLMKNNGF